MTQHPATPLHTTSLDFVAQISATLLIGLNFFHCVRLVGLAGLFYIYLVLTGFVLT